MKIAIRHDLSLVLGPGVQRGVEHLLLTPQSGPTQNVLGWSIEMPGIETAATFIDGFGNRAHLVSQVKPEAELLIAVSGTIETIDRNGVIGKPWGDTPPALYRRPTAETKPIGAITSKFRTAPRTGADRIPLLHALMTRVAEVIGGPEEAPAQAQSQTGDDATHSQSQSQSQSAPEASTTEAAPRPPASAYAHAFIGTARALEIPARYVSGYLALAEDGATALHAWVEAWDDGLGWIAFDPMLGYCPTDRHVRIAVGLDAASTPMVRSVPVVSSPENRELSVSVAQ
jgi:transglutaminase-like putative cysteine protease